MIVLKIGGSEGTDFEKICADIGNEFKAGRRFVIVHGGSKETNNLSEVLGYPPRFVTSFSGQPSRYTDRRTLEIFAMAVVGKVNTLIVEVLQRYGVNAIGLTGLDGRLLEAHRKETIKVIEDGKKKILRGDYTGTVKAVNVGLLRVLIKKGYTPVVAPLAISEIHEAVNVDGDRTAAAIAGALGADQLVIFSNVPGLLRDPADENTLIHFISAASVDDFSKYAAGRMKKKIMAAQEAVRGGVREVILADGRKDYPLVRAFTGECTLIKQ